MNPKIVVEFLAECQDDYVGLWSLVGRSRQASDGVGDEQRRDLILEKIHELLQQEKIVAGSFVDKKTFLQWREDPEAIVNKIRGQWLALGRDPDIGEIVWFTARTAQ